MVVEFPRPESAKGKAGSAEGRRGGEGKEALTHVGGGGEGGGEEEEEGRRRRSGWWAFFPSLPSASSQA